MVEEASAKLLATLAMAVAERVFWKVFRLSQLDLHVPREG
jgi:hypothetical protein